MKVLVLGAGQLARMMALAAKPLNIEIRAYDVGSDSVVDPLATTTNFGSLSAGIEYADAITAEFEHFSHEVLDLCEQSGKLFPSAQAIKTGGDRRLEKKLLEKTGVANANHKVVTNQSDFELAIETLPLPIIFKSALAGYDGKGQWRLKDKAQASDIWQDINSFFEGAADSESQAVIAEQMVPFDREVSLVGVRCKSGETKVYPITENHHTNGVLTVSLALAESHSIQQQAADAFDKIADGLNYVGVLAIEFFQVGDKLLVNEIAPRVHNSGHWTQQGADACQFENHIRAVSNLPLGNTELIRPTAMVNVLGTDQLSHDIFAIPSVAMHWYGKGKRPGRKMGHINVCGQDKAELVSRLIQLANILPVEDFPEVADYVNQI